jgi:hydroxymethylpyrimidine pyrophosphatase-like HAD family hydrolase
LRHLAASGEHRNGCAEVTMRFRALATDYDGTLAHNGVVDSSTLTGLDRVRASGRRLILVTGRELPELLGVFPHLDKFDRVVAENGALVYDPVTRAERVLAEPPPPPFLDQLRRQGVAPMSVGRAIVATWEPHEKTVLEIIHELGLEMQVIFNKGAVMILPSGVNKATGLKAALKELEIAPENVVAVGDAENDHALLELCGCGAAVSNALPMLRARAEIDLKRDHGAGVVELIDMLLVDDLAGCGKCPRAVRPQKT